MGYNSGACGRSPKSLPGWPNQNYQISSADALEFQSKELRQYADQLMKVAMQAQANANRIRGHSHESVLHSAGCQTAPSQTQSDSYRMRGQSLDSCLSSLSQFSGREKQANANRFSGLCLDSMFTTRTRQTYPTESQMPCCASSFSEMGWTPKTCMKSRT